MDLTALINRVENRLQKLDLLHDLVGREIEETRDDLSALKAAAGLPGQQELPDLSGPAAGPDPHA